MVHVHIPVDKLTGRVGTHVARVRSLTGVRAQVNTQRHLPLEALPAQVTNQIAPLAVDPHVAFQQVRPATLETAHLADVLPLGVLPGPVIHKGYPVGKHLVTIGARHCFAIGVVSGGVMNQILPAGKAFSAVGTGVRFQALVSVHVAIEAAPGDDGLTHVTAYVVTEAVSHAVLLEILLLWQAVD